jgi:HAMP domain-containing protein
MAVRRKVDSAQKEIEMANTNFDLNDIQHEPSDEQLDSLMESVAEKARQRAQLARQALMVRLRDDIARAQQTLSAA